MWQGEERGSMCVCVMCAHMLMSALGEGQWREGRKKNTSNSLQDATEIRRHLLLNVSLLFPEMVILQ